MKINNIKKALIAMVVFLLGLTIFGVLLGYFYSILPVHHPQDSQRNCELAGGEWSLSGQYCLIGNKKAGEICTDGGQCESGVCFPPKLSETQLEALKQGPIEPITGTCYLEEDVMGCVPQVLKGKITKESMCLDD